jgi:hypothetical protein
MSILGLIRFFRNGPNPGDFSGPILIPVDRKGVRFGEPGNETTLASFVSPGHKKKLNPRVAPSGSNPTRQLPQREASGSTRWRDVALAAWEAGKRQREVVSCRREVIAWRHESSPTSSSRPVSSNSSSGFSPISAFRPPSPSFPSPAAGVG